MTAPALTAEQSLLLRRGCRYAVIRACTVVTGGREEPEGTVKSLHRSERSAHAEARLHWLKGSVRVVDLSSGDPA